MCNYKLILRKIEVGPPIPDSMIPVDCCQKYESIINFTTDDITYKFEFFSKNKMNNPYLTEIMQTDCLQMLDAYWDEKDK